MSDHEHDVEWEAVMPFVVCTSQGGPYDDPSFVAGWELGELDTRLAVLDAVHVHDYSATVRTDSMPQVELIAMKYGLVLIDRIDHLDGWTSVLLDVDDTDSTSL